MSDRRLTEAAWKTVATKHKVKEPTLGKLLGTLEKTAADDFAAKLKLFADIRKEVESLQKIYKSKEEVVEYVEDIADVTLREEKEVKAKQAEAEKSGGDDDTSVDPAKLKAKVLAALNAVKTHDPLKPALTFMAATSKAKNGVLIAPNVGNTQKTMLLAMLHGVATPKFLTGDCLWEENTHTFVLEKVPGGLSKKLAKALLEETGTKFRVRVRSFDGKTVADSDTEAEVEEEEDETEAQADGGKDAFLKALGALKPSLDRVIAGQTTVTEQVKTLFAQIAGQARSGQFDAALAALPNLVSLVKTGLAQLGGGTTTESKPQSTPTEADYRDHLTKLLPKIKDAIAAGGNGDALKARAGEANNLFKAGNIVAAMAILAELEQQLAGGSSPQSKPKPTLPEWESAVEQATAQLEGLRTHLRQTEDPQMEQIADGPLGGIADRLASSLKATLASFDQQAPGSKEAIPGEVAEFRTFLDSELVKLLDENPFSVNVALRSTLSPALDTITQAAA